MINNSLITALMRSVGSNNSAARVSNRIFIRNRSKQGARGEGRGFSCMLQLQRGIKISDGRRTEAEPVHRLLFVLANCTERAGVSKGRASEEKEDEYCSLTRKRLTEGNVLPAHRYTGRDHRTN